MRDGLLQDIEHHHTGSLVGPSTTLFRINPFKLLALRTAGGGLGVVPGQLLPHALTGTLNTVINICLSRLETLTWSRESWVWQLLVLTMMTSLAMVEDSSASDRDRLETGAITILVDCSSFLSPKSILLVLYRENGLSSTELSL